MKSSRATSVKELQSKQRANQLQRSLTCGRNYSCKKAGTPFSQILDVIQVQSTPNSPNILTKRKSKCESSCSGSQEENGSRKASAISLGDKISSLLCLTGQVWISLLLFLHDYIWNLDFYWELPYNQQKQCNSWWSHRHAAEKAQ